MKTLLNVGCGHSNISELKGFNSDSWKEIRLDIDETVKPDLVGSITDMNIVETGSIDAIHSAYSLDHIYAHEIPIALREFYRVLNDDGIAILKVKSPSAYRVPRTYINKKLDPHIHYRFCKTPGMLSDVQTITL